MAEMAEPQPGGPAAGPAAIADSLTPREWEQLVDIVVRRLERRIAEDLERRGRRAAPRTL